jgi:hypothetical protein
MKIKNSQLVTDLIEWIILRLSLVFLWYFFIHLSQLLLPISRPEQEEKFQKMTKGFLHLFWIFNDGRQVGECFPIDVPYSKRWKLFVRTLRDAFWYYSPD